MPADQGLVDWLRQNRHQALEEPSPLFEDTAEAIGWVVQCCRVAGDDEVERVELLLTALDPHREELRRDAKILRRLGYRSVASMMQRLARKAKPRPPRWCDRHRAPIATMASPPLVPPNREAARAVEMLTRPRGR
jgi:hypothetical protein